MFLPTLFDKTERGLERWSMEVDGPKYRVHHGLMDGKIQVTKWTLAESKNVGRANETSADEQALAEATSKWEKKIKKGARKSVAELDAKTDSEPPEPMLAKTYDAAGGPLAFPVISQPKLDGYRCMIRKDGCWTRGHEKLATMDHLFKIFEPLFVKYPDFVFDGELYNHKYAANFNKLQSLISKKKPTAAELERIQSEIFFYWYDLNPGKKSLMTNEDRDEFRARLFTQLTQDLPREVESESFVTSGPFPVVFVQSTECPGLSELDDRYLSYIIHGCEGQMIRDPEALYKTKRTESLLKRKESRDSDYLIEDICEGRGNKSGQAGYAVLRREDGVTFQSAFKFSHDECVEILQNKEKYIGMYAKTLYFNLTPDGIPRFPRIIAFRKKPGIDF